MTHEFTVTESLKKENSYAVIDRQQDVKLHVTIGFNSEDYGWFELYDEETTGDRWYAEGGLWFEGKTLTEYDGVFALPKCIIDKLKELGYDASYAE